MSLGARIALTVILLALGGLSACWTLLAKAALLLARAAVEQTDVRPMSWEDGRATFWPVFLAVLAIGVVWS